MVAGFGSRLREKIDSIRPTNNSSSSSSSSSPWGGSATGGAFSSSGGGGGSASNSANIRGLTRLGGGASASAAVSSSGKKTVGAATTSGTSRGGGVGGTSTNISATTSAVTGTGSGGSQGGKNSGTAPTTSLPSSSSSAAAASSTTLSQPVLPSGGLLRGRTAAAVATTGTGSSATGIVSEGALQHPLAPPPPSLPREHNATATTNTTTTTIPTTATTTHSSSLLKNTATNSSSSRGATAAAKSPLPLHMPALGGSKIVPGWGAATTTTTSSSTSTTAFTTSSTNNNNPTAANHRTHHPHAPSGHLVGLHTHNNNNHNNNNSASTITAASSAPSRDHYRGGGGSIASTTATLNHGTSPLSMTTTTTTTTPFSRRRRWGDEDEEEDSDETEFPNLASSLEKDGTMKKKKTQLPQQQQQQGAHGVSTATTTTSSYRGGGGGGGGGGGEQNSSSRWQHAHLGGSGGGGGGGSSHYRPSSGGGGGGGGGGESTRFYTGEYDRHDSWRNNNDSTSRTASSSTPSLGGFQYSSRDYNNSNNPTTAPTNRSSPGGNIHGGYYSERGGGSGGGGFSSSSYYDNGQYREHRDYNRDSWSKSRVHNWRSSSSSSNDHEDHNKFSSSNWRSASSSMRIDETAGHANNNSSSSNTNTSNSTSLWSFTQREHLHISGSNNARHGGADEGGGGGGRFDRDGGESSRGGNNHSFFSSPQGNKASDAVTEREKGTLNSGDAASLSTLADRTSQLGPNATNTQRDEASARTRRSQVTSDPTTIVRLSTTPMVLLRSNNGNPSGAQTRTELASKSTEATTDTRSADGASEGTLGVLSAKLEKLDSFPSVRANSSQPPNAWVTVSPTTATSVSDDKSSDASKGIDEVPADSSVATTARANPPSTETPDPKDTEQDKIELAKEQQQNVLRQVAERRAAAVASSSKSDVKIERKKPEKELSPSEGRDGKEDIQPSATTTEDPAPARKGRFDIDRTDTNRNSKSEQVHRGVKAKSKPRSNPCRIEGHDHPWSDCPQNPKSEKFVRDNPCRIDGHDHDWSDCPDNPKSDNYVKPTYKKGKSRDPKSLGNIKDSLAVSEGDPNEKGNPCRIDGHDHDWKDCTNNPKSVNYVKKKGKGRGPKSTGIKKDSPTVSEGDLEEKDLSNLKEEECKADNTDQEVVAEPVKELPEPTEPKVTPAKPKPFVPAPPPAVPAWTKGNPLTIGSPPPTTTPESSNPEKPGVSTTPSALGSGSALPSSHIHTPLESIQRQLLETKLDEAAARTSSLLAPSRTDLSLVAITPQEVAAKQRALFDGNTALFGKAESSSVYDSWNTPQIGMANASIGLWRQTPFAPTTTAMSPLAGQFGSTWSASAASLAQPQRRESLPTESNEKLVAPVLPVESVTVDDHVNTSEKGSETEDDIKARSVGKSGMAKKYDYPSHRRQRKSFQRSGDRGMPKSKDGEEGTDEAAVDNDVKAEAKRATKTLSSRRHLPKSAAAQKGKSKGQVVDGITGSDDAVADESKPVTKRMTSHHRRSTFAGKGKSKGIVESRGNDDAAVGDVNFKPSMDKTTSSSPGEGHNEQEASHTAPNNQDGTKSGTNRTKRPPKKFGGGGRGKNNNGTRPPRKLEDNGISSATATTKEGESEKQQPLLSHLASGKRNGNRKALNQGENGGTIANTVHEN